MWGTEQTPHQPSASHKHCLSLSAWVEPQVLHWISPILVMCVHVSCMVLMYVHAHTHAHMAKVMNVSWTMHTQLGLFSSLSTHTCTCTHTHTISCTLQLNEHLSHSTSGENIMQHFNNSTLEYLASSLYRNINTLTRMHAHTITPYTCKPNQMQLSIQLAYVAAVYKK